MKNISSQHMQAKITPEHLRWAQSVDRTLSGGIDMGTPTGKNSAGVYNTFDKGNSSGVLFRVGANGSSESYTWDSSGNLTIMHGLGRQPVGFQIMDIDKASVSVHRTAVPTDQQIVLQSSDKTANATIYVF